MDTYMRRWPTTVMEITPASLSLAFSQSNGDAGYIDKISDKRALLSMVRPTVCDKGEFPVQFFLLTSSVDLGFVSMCIVSHVQCLSSIHREHYHSCWYVLQELRHLHLVDA